MVSRSLRNVCWTI